MSFISGTGIKTRTTIVLTIVAVVITGVGVGILWELSKSEYAIGLVVMRQQDLEVSIDGENVLISPKSYAEHCDETFYEVKIKGGIHTLRISDMKTGDNKKLFFILTEDREFAILPQGGSITIFDRLNWGCL